MRRDRHAERPFWPCSLLLFSSCTLLSLPVVMRPAGSGLIKRLGGHDDEEVSYCGQGIEKKVCESSVTSLNSQ